MINTLLTRVPPDQLGDWRGAYEAWKKALEIVPHVQGGAERHVSLVTPTGFAASVRRFACTVRG